MGLYHSTKTSCSLKWHGSFGSPSGMAPTIHVAIAVGMSITTAEIISQNKKCDLCRAHLSSATTPRMSKSVCRLKWRHAYFSPEMPRISTFLTMALCAR